MIVTESQAMIRSLAGLSLLAMMLAGQTAQQRLRPVVRQVDHIVVQSDDPKQLFDVLTGTLRLPVAYPLRTESGSTTAGVGAGNVSIELFRPADAGDRPGTGRPRARFTGLAFEPYQPLAQTLPELQARGIACAPPQSYASTLPDGSQGTLWTTVVLPQLSNSGLSVFLSEYNRAFLNVEVRRKQWGGELALSKGGPLGFESVREIIIGTRSPEKDGAVWQKLSLPAGDGPEIHLIKSGTEGIQRIVLKVKSLERAKDYLRAQRWLGAVSENEAAIAASAVQGLSIRLLEKGGKQTGSQDSQDKNDPVNPVILSKAFCFPATLRCSCSA